MRAALLTACLAFVPANTDAHACTYREPDQMKVLRMSGEPGFAVALVRIVAVEPPRSGDGNVHGWRAQAKVERVVRGERSERTVPLVGGLDTDACGDGRPLPAIGSLWFAYFGKGEAHPRVIEPADRDALSDPKPFLFPTRD